MHDEDSGEETKCPHCGSTGNCEHQLAVLDLTHGTCDGGYLHRRLGALEALVENVFKAALASAARAAVEFDDPDVQELWEHAVENDGGPGADPDIDRGVFLRLVCGALDGAGGEEAMGAVDDGDGPGNASALAVYFAEDPPAVFGAAMAAIANALDTGVSVVLPDVEPAPTARPLRKKSTLMRKPPRPVALAKSPKPKPKSKSKGRKKGPPKRRAPKDVSPRR